MKLKQILLSVLSIAATQGAVASTNTVVSIFDAAAKQTTWKQDIGPISSASSLTVGSSTAFASADEGSGIERASTVAPSMGGYSDADGAMSDTLTFGAGASGVASLVLHITGTVSAFTGQGIRADGDFTVNIAGPGTGLALYREFANVAPDPGFPNDCTGNPSAVCQVGTVFDYKEVITFDIQPGTFSISPDVGAHAAGGGSADFTAGLYLSIPSGVDYTTALPIGAPVPEPSSPLLMAAGMAFLGLGVVRSRRQDGSPGSA